MKKTSDEILRDLANPSNITDQKLEDIVTHLRASGRNSEAIKLLSDIIDNYGYTFLVCYLQANLSIQQSKLENAEQWIFRAKKCDNTDRRIVWNEVRLLLKRNQATAALEKAQEGIVACGRTIEGLLVLSGCLRVCGRLGESIACLNEIFTQDPHNPDALVNRALLRLDQREESLALADLELCYKYRPNWNAIWETLANLYYKKAAYNEACEFLQKLTGSSPNNYKYWQSLGMCNQRLLNFVGAISCYQKVLELVPNDKTAILNIGHAFQYVAYQQPAPQIPPILLQVLDSSTQRPKSLAGCVISLLKLEASVQNCLQDIRNDVLNETFIARVNELSKITLLLKFLSLCPVSDLQLEGMLQSLRSAFLHKISVGYAEPSLHSFLSALCAQCYINEYLYEEDSHETNLINMLSDTVEALLSKGDQPNSFQLLVLGSFRALNSFKWIGMVIITNQIRPAFTQQVLDPDEERDLKRGIPKLSEIDDDISKKVREQYETNPYPRWISAPVNEEPLSLDRFIKESQIRVIQSWKCEVDKPAMLIAGCGTGQHSIEASRKIKDAHVTAIDLSLSSLAYAKRKTNEFGIENIEYINMDILDANKLDKKFDIIESGGVLHHMKDPLAGWYKLRECLTANGLMKIGLYSELARQHIVKTRDEIALQQIKTSNKEIRNFRASIINSKYDHYQPIIQSPDFYSMSTLRDLLFHVQEHRFTIPQIRQHLKELGLYFCGFQNKSIITAFRNKHPNKCDLFDLDLWEAFENQNPTTFVGMYQFWCQSYS